MDKIDSDNPGDCRIVARADSTTKVIEAKNMAPTITTREGLRRHHQQQQQQQQQHQTTTLFNETQQQVSSTTTIAAAAASASTTTASTKSKSPTPPPSKLKAQQQLQQHHQFRAPQQFVKQCKNATSLKKQKTWSKRQHNKMCKQNVAANLIGIGQVLVMGGGGAGAGTTSAAAHKADLENIQNVKNQIHHGRLAGAVGNIANPQVGVIGASSVVTSGVASVGVPQGIIGASSGLEKLGHCHGHLKPQTYKKMLSHGRGVHHNHVLCAGAAHNTQAQCCLANGCTGVSAVVDKDNPALSGVAANNAAALVNPTGAQHYCCGRSKFFLPEKRIRKEVFIPPTKFLLGGNISDPLNLNSLQNETSSNANSTNNTPGTTPRQSPITTPPKVEVIIPPNIHDPLHLLDPVDSMEYEKQLTSPMKRGGILRGGGSHLKVPHHGGVGVGGGGGGNKHRNRKNRKRRSRNDSETSSNNASTLGNSTLPTGVETTTATLMSSAAAMTTTTTTAAVLAATEESTTTVSLSTTVKPPLSISLSDNSDELLNVSEQQQQQLQNNLLSISDGTNQIEETSKILTEIAAKVIKETSAAGGIDESITAITERLRSPTEVPPTTTPTTTTSTLTMLASELLTRAAVKRLERETETATAATALTAMPTTPNIQQQHVEANDAPLLLTTAAAAVPIARRVDLHLDLSNLSSTCYAAGLGSGGSSGSGNNGFGRKRKISESNNSQKSKKFHRNDGMDKIVSPVVPQPGTWKRPPRQQPTGARKPNQRRSTSFSESELLSPIDEVKLTLEVEIPRDDTPDFTKGIGAVDTASETFLGSPLSTISAATSLTMGEQDSLADVSLGDASTVLTSDIKTEAEPTPGVTSGDAVTEMTAKVPKFRADGAKFRYGNFDRYVDYRQIHEFRDVRLQVFQRHLELFQNKDILDIGCNVGHMTITVARNLAPKSILGIDVDRELVARARRNLSMFVRIPTQSIKPKMFKNENGAAVKQENVNHDNGNDKESALDKKHKKTRRKKRRHGHGAAVAGGISALENQMRLHYLLHHHHQHFHHHFHHQHFHHQHLHHQHIHHYHSQQEQIQQQKLRELHVEDKEFFPISFPLIYGGIPSATLLQKLTGTAKTTPSAGGSSVGGNAITSTSNSTPGGNATTSSAAGSSNSISAAVNVVSSTTKTKHKNSFPQNVFFRHMNYVLKDEALLANDTQQYDLILCLSVTKWIHLNFGDAGLKLAFKRMFNQLRPGGKLILEAQNWASYKKKKNLTPEIYEHYKKIEFFPNKFHEYLLSSDVGFSHSYTLGVPRHMNKGFSRPIQLYAKGDYTPNHVRWSDAYYPQTPYEAYRGIYATMAPRPLLEGGASGGSIGGIVPGSMCIGSGGGSSTGGGSGGSGSLPFNLGSARSQNYDTPHYTGGGSGSYSCRQTPMHQPTSQYYNPLETDSYQPSYDMEYLNHMYVFASPLYQTVWSPPASLRKSSSHTPVFGSVREAELDGDGSMGGGGSGGSSYHRHVYPPNDDTCSPNANAGYAFNSIRDPDTDDSNQLPGVSQRHVYATTVNCGESSSSPQVSHHDSETIEALMLDEDPQQQQSSQPQQQQQQQTINNVAGNPNGNYCDLNDA